MSYELWVMIYGLFLIVVCFLLITCYTFLFIGFRNVTRFHKQLNFSKNADIVEISVIVAARNEAENLPRLLEALAKQTHTRYEVIVVDDRSTDATAAIVQAFIEKEYPQKDRHFRLISIPHEEVSNKKNALTKGIEAARFERLVFTDADCVPPETWLRGIATSHHFEPEALFIGYSPMISEKGLLNRFIRFETLFTAYLTASATGLNRAYMAVGRNLSYTKAAFQQVQGFDSFKASLSGDDDLFVQAIRKKTDIPIRYVLHATTFVPAEPMHTWKTWFRQKTRHFSAGRFYDRNMSIALGVFQLLNALLWLSPFFLGNLGFVLILLKWLVMGICLSVANRYFQEKGILYMLPILDALYLLMNLVVAPLGLRRVPEKWN